MSSDAAIKNKLKQSLNVSDLPGNLILAQGLPTDKIRFFELDDGDRNPNTLNSLLSVDVKHNDQTHRTVAAVMDDQLTLLTTQQAEAIYRKQGFDDVVNSVTKNINPITGEKQYGYANEQDFINPLSDPAVKGLYDRALAISDQDKIETSGPLATVDYAVVKEQMPLLSKDQYAAVMPSKAEPAKQEVKQEETTPAYGTKEYYDWLRDKDESNKQSRLAELKEQQEKIKENVARMEEEQKTQKTERPAASQDTSAQEAMERVAKNALAEIDSALALHEKAKDIPIERHTLSQEEIDALSAAYTARMRPVVEEALKQVPAVEEAARKFTESLQEQYGQYFEKLSHLNQEEINEEIKKQMNSPEAQNLVAEIAKVHNIKPDFNVQSGMSGQNMLKDLGIAPDEQTNPRIVELKGETYVLMKEQGADGDVDYVLKGVDELRALHAERSENLDGIGESGLESLNQLDDFIRRAQLASTFGAEFEVDESSLWKMPDAVKAAVERMQDTYTEQQIEQKFEAGLPGLK